MRLSQLLCLRAVWPIHEEDGKLALDDIHPSRRKKRWWKLVLVWYKVETPIHDSMRELVTWECKEHGVKSRMC